MSNSKVPTIRAIKLSSSFRRSLEESFRSTGSFREERLIIEPTASLEAEIGSLIKNFCLFDISQTLLVLIAHP